jgi:hypothetical protein
MDISLSLHMRVLPPRQQPFNRRLLALAALLAFFLQSLAVQTHIHPTSSTSTKLVVTVADVSTPGPLTAPDIGQGSCRLCQEMAHAGSYIVPVATPFLAILVLAHELFRLEPVEHSRQARAFAWQSRGPPHH